MRAILLILLVMGLVFVAGCGGGTTGYTPAPPSGGGCGVSISPLGQSLGGLDDAAERTGEV